MTDNVQALLREALTLPVSQRAELVQDLLASLEDRPTDEPLAVEQAWRDELERRARQVLAGNAPTVDWNEVRGAIRRQISPG